MKIVSRWLSVALVLLTPLTVFGQDKQLILKGQILDADNSVEPLTGANLFWLNTEIGAVSDVEGNFEIPFHGQSKMLVASFIGYSSDTIQVTDDAFLMIYLRAGTTLENVEIVHRRKATEFSFLNPAKVEKINEKELLKAACCNLSESFETNPSVDMAFTDAITGTRQIQMLGLAGPYTQITRENVPYIRGLASSYGLTFVPGTWVEGMQLSKGAGSVINGFESIAGQINVELRKPEESDKLYLNLYTGSGARMEANANYSAKIGDKWSTAFLLHGKTNQRKMDRNNDGFLDEPNSKNFIALNRWKYIADNGFRFQFGINGTSIDNVGGQVAFDPDRDGTEGNYWGLKMNIHRLEGWFKAGKVYEDIPWRSWAVQISAVDHQQDSYFGRRVYLAAQKSLYSNFLYQSIIGNVNHQVLMGLSLQYDDYREEFEEILYDRTEKVPGAFFEYTYGGHEKFSLVAGLRADHHNQFGFFMTPRLHTRYAFTDQLVWRASAGRGQRTANILAENIGLMASNRSLTILGDDTDKPYGLEAEVAWNAGTNLIHTFTNRQHPGSISLDLYHTIFQNQIVIDIDQAFSEVLFYNLEGKSFATSAQLQVDYELAPQFDLRMAYRYYNVKTTFTNGLLQKPLVAKDRLFLNLAYATKTNWSFDYTVSWQGTKRLPDTSNNPVAYQISTNSPGFAVMNAQVSKKWWERFEVYVGAENLLNYRQPNPIIGNEDPFGTYFDSSLIWGPIFGRNLYLGMRYRIS